MRFQCPVDLTTYFCIFVLWSSGKTTKNQLYVMLRGKKQQSKAVYFENTPEIGIGVESHTTVQFI